MCLQEEYDRADLTHPGRRGKVPLSPRLAAGLTQGVRGGLPLVRGSRGGSRSGSGLQIQVSVSDREKMKSVDMSCVSGLGMAGDGQWPHCQAAQGTGPHRAAAQCPADAAVR